MKVRKNKKNPQTDQLKMLDLIGRFKKKKG